MVDFAPRSVAIALAVLLAGCAGNRVLPRSESAVDAAQAERRTDIDRIRDWSFDGRVAVSNGSDGGSARIEWKQTAGHADIVMRAPVTGQTWQLSGSDGRGWHLQGTRAGGVRGDDAEALMLRETGWLMPFNALRHWLFGLAHAPGDRIELRASGLPARLRSTDGWTVEYVDYDEQATVALPTRLRADRAPHKVRLAISEWRIRD